VVFALSRRGLRTRDDGSRFWQRGSVALLWLVLTVVSLFAVNGGMKDRTANSYVNELAGNGIYQFFAAFRSSHLDYAKFYRTLPDDKAFSILREQLKTPDATYLSDDPQDLTRAISRGPEKHLNVVLISVESLSGDYLGTFGNKENLTPYLDSLVGQSVFFDNLYANGTRTVRGLEALALSVPPTPGDSLIREHHNENLFSLADIFNDRGYQSDFVYGGYGYFDNMNYFFSHNGYRTVDRGDIPKDAPIHSQNVWGVSDEDLYTLALKQMDDPRRWQAVFPAHHDHLQPPAVHLPGRPGAADRTVPPGFGGVHRLVDQGLHRARAQQAVLRQHRVRDHRRPLRLQRRQDQLPINHYHIPLWIYSPKNFPPQRVEQVMGQLDIPPTLLGMLNFSYRTRFFGQDVFQLPPKQGHALPGTYEKLGYLRDDVLTVLEPQRKLEQFKPDYATGDATPINPQNQTLIDQAVRTTRWPANSSAAASSHRPSDSTPVTPLPAAVPPACASTSSVQPRRLRQVLRCALPIRLAVRPAIIRPNANSGTEPRPP
jgi:hypothetical protein